MIYERYEGPYPVNPTKEGLSAWRELRARMVELFKGELKRVYHLPWASAAVHEKTWELSWDEGHQFGLCRVEELYQAVSGVLDLARWGT